jgi:hypothetical protein
MVIMRVLVVELLCQEVTKQILVLECLLSGTCGRLWLRLVLLALNDIATRGSRLWGHLPGTGNPQALLPRAWACVRPGHKAELRSG